MGLSVVNWGQRYSDRGRAADFKPSCEARSATDGDNWWGAYANLLNDERLFTAF